MYCNMYCNNSVCNNSRKVVICLYQLISLGISLLFYKITYIDCKNLENSERKNHQTFSQSDHAHVVHPIIRFDFKTQNPFAVKLKILSRSMDERFVTYGVIETLGNKDVREF